MTTALQTAPEPLAIPERMTLAEFHAFPFPEGTRWELLDGVPTELSYEPLPEDDMATPTPEHQLCVSATLAAWHRFSPEPALWALLVAPFELELPGGESVQPDLAVLTEPLTFVDDDGPRRIRGVPAVAAEILSPSTAGKDIGRKYHQYRLAGAKEYWIIDPETCELFLHVLSGSHYHRQNADVDGYCLSPHFSRRVRVIRRGSGFAVEDRPAA